MNIGRWLFILGALGMTGVAAVACSDSSGGGTGGASSSSGHGGAGSTSTSKSSSSTSTSGSTTSSQSGTGGAGPCGTSAWKKVGCQPCFEQSCCADGAACQADQACSETVTCRLACADGDQACAMQCDQLYQSSLFQTLLGCIINNCKAACL